MTIIEDELEYAYCKNLILYITVVRIRIETLLSNGLKMFWKSVDISKLKKETKSLDERMDK